MIFQDCLKKQLLEENKTKMWDELFFQEIADYCIDKNECSIDDIMKQFEIGYTKAIIIVKLFESLGIVSKEDNNHKRTILISKEQLSKMLEPCEIDISSDLKKYEIIEKWLVNKEYINELEVADAFRVNLDSVPVFIDFMIKEKMITKVNDKYKVNIYLVFSNDRCERIVGYDKARYYFLNLIKMHHENYKELYDYGGMPFWARYYFEDLKSENLLTAEESKWFDFAFENISRIKYQVSFNSTLEVAEGFSFNHEGLAKSQEGGKFIFRINNDKSLKIVIVDGENWFYTNILSLSEDYFTKNKSITFKSRQHFVSSYDEDKELCGNVINDYYCDVCFRMMKL